MKTVLCRDEAHVRRPAKEVLLHRHEANHNEEKEGCADGHHGARNPDGRRQAEARLAEEQLAQEKCKCGSG